MAPPPQLADPPEVGSQSPRRSRLAVVVALVVAVSLFGLVAVLATLEAPTTRAADSPLLGRRAPELAAETMDGETFTLAETQGQWVLVNFFATWCVPCRREHPELIEFHERHQMLGDATVVGVIYDDEVNAVRQFRDEEGGSWPMLVDGDGRIALDFGVAGVPESFLIAPDGVIVAKVVGGVRAHELERLLDQAQASY
ncbi:MAG: TlpA family protein disulfide reductase [Actinobacteria bacterium]|nr:TlpA family protein disulfide reductase [Actinomycetota bacterium]